MASIADSEPNRSDTTADERRRRYLVAAVVGAALVAAVVAAYYVLPTDWGGGTHAAFRVVTSVAILLAAIAVAIRVVRGSQYPMVRALQALTLGVAFAIVSFASAYSIMSYDDESAFSEPLGRTDALYFSMTTATTVGFGDVSAKSESARIVVMVHMVVNVAVLGGVTRLLLRVARGEMETR